MTKRHALPLLLGLALLLANAPAVLADTATLELVWVDSTRAGAVGLGTDTIRAAPGDQVLLELRLTAGTGGISFYGFSLGFDADGLDELDVLSTEEFNVAADITCSPFPQCFFDTPTMTPLSPGVSGVEESIPGSTGFVFTFEAGTCGNGATDTFGAFAIGQVWFEVNESVASDGSDVESGLFNVGTDGVFTNAGQPVVMNFGSAAVDVIPEPAPVALVALGLAALAVRSSRRRSRAGRKAPSHCARPLV